MTSASAPLAVLAIFFWVRVSIADATPDTASVAARLEVRAAPACTTPKDVTARVLARSPHIRFVDDGTGLVVRADFTALRSGKVFGELVIAGPRAKPSSRRLIADSCAEAADAVALIIAVTLDPMFVSNDGEASSGQPTSTSNADASASASTAPSSQPAAVAKSATNSAEQLATSRPQAPRVAANPVEASSSTAPAVARFRIGADVAVQSFLGPAPEVMPGIAAYAIAALDRHALWSPAIVVGAAHAWTTGLREPGGTASFTLDAASVDACPLRLRISAFEGRACGSALLGSLSGTGTDTRAPATVVRPFAVAGASAALTADLGSILVLSARLMAGATLVRDSFEFGQVTFYRAAPFSVSASLGIGVRSR